jgi:hypothetical protein
VAKEFPLDVPGGFYHPVEMPTPEGGKYISGGLTLRDWFAGQALASMPDYLKPMQTDQRIRMAEWAYGLADALIAERDHDRP